MQHIDEIIAIIDEAVDDNAMFVNTSFIKYGFDKKRDSYADILSSSTKWLETYQKKIISDTGVGSLKIKYTKNVGYYIEVSKNHTLKDCIHIQSLTNVHRYTTSELQSYEQRVLEAESCIFEREAEIFDEIVDKLGNYTSDLRSISSAVAYTDFLLSGAYYFGSVSSCLPVFDQKNTLEICAGKHPIILTAQKEFIHNDLEMNKNALVHIITGPNMGGKSTFLRQNALLIIMAHIGYPVPAESMKLSLTDKIFSRVGSGDNIVMGKSTFMVEMEEMSYILRSATKNSFIIIDEIGRGTSTYDGMSIAWAILYYISTKLGAKTLFATHYHELIDRSKELKNAKNFSVAVGENTESLVFLRKVIPGGVKKSYGLEVAKIAGVGEEILSLARQTLMQLMGSYTQTHLDIINDNEDLAYKDDLKKLETYISDINIYTSSPKDIIGHIEHLQELIKKNK